MGARNQTRIFCKSSPGSELLSHLSSPQKRTFQRVVHTRPHQDGSWCRSRVGEPSRSCSFCWVGKRRCPSQCPPLCTWASLSLFSSRYSLQPAGLAPASGSVVGRGSSSQSVWALSTHSRILEHTGLRYPELHNYRSSWGTGDQQLIPVPLPPPEWGDQVECHIQLQRARKSSVTAYASFCSG